MVTDSDLQELKWRLIKLEGKVDFLYKHLGVTFVPEPAPADDPRIIEAIKKGNVMEAIRLHRTIFDTSAPDAKQAIEEIRGRLGI